MTTRAIYTVEISVDVPGPGRTAANVQAVDRWHTIRQEIEDSADEIAISGLTVELKRMRLSAAEQPAGPEAQSDG